MAATETTFTTIERLDGVTHALIKCEKITEREAGIIAEELCAAASQTEWKIVIDCEPIELLASAGIGTFVTIHRRCDDHKGRMVVYHVNDDLMGVLKLTRLHKLFKIAKNKGAALKLV